MTYPEYLETSHWEQVAKAARERGNHQCALCSWHRGPFHVHHRNYDRLFHERDTDVIVLCERCHQKFHGTFEECAERQLLLPHIPHGPDLN